MVELYSGHNSPSSLFQLPDATCVRRRNGKIWGCITSVIIDGKTCLPAAAIVLVERTQHTQRVPWSYLQDTGNGYRLTVGIGELALLPDQLKGNHPDELSK